MSTKSTAPAALTTLHIVAHLLDGGRSEVPRMLLAADAELPALLESTGDEPSFHNPLGDYAVGVAAQRLATTHGTRDYVTSRQSVESAGADDVDIVRTNERQAAFALGMALGLRLGGAR
jgi:hypothetical protein